MSFKFPSFDLKSIQESLPSVDQVKESFTKTGDQLSKSIQPYTSKTTQLISDQLKNLEQLANNANSDIEVSELPQDYLQLEANCDLLLKLYTDLIQSTNETYGKVSYDYPPGNYAINKIKDANVGGLIGQKFTQLKNAASPQELEKVLLGQDTTPKDQADSPAEESVSIQPTSPQIPKTLYGHLAEVCVKHSEELKKSEHPLSFALLQISSTYQEIAVARLDQDKQIMSSLNSQLIKILNDSFIKVNELRKKVYGSRGEFDLLRHKYEKSDPENEQLIAKEDEFVSATEVAVVEMKKLLKPSKNIDLLKVLVTAQKEYFEVGAKKLTDLLNNLDKIPVTGEDEEE
ncbi:GVP36 Protein GVP36 [Candida maltosa Xu316]|uniref:Putative Golgi-vesicle protein n=1 Tax=Candida maltosa (strain Xu316) TaxID=1245528 RepID=M3JC60_CANMX|nr:putative Golgi-vesicle protein [Candida maltosa Xu316]